MDEPVKHKCKVKTTGAATKITVNRKPKVKDYRPPDQSLFFGNPLWEGWIPDGVTNEVIPMYENFDEEKAVGEIQSGAMVS